MKETSIDEQDICVSCGFCCDSTLFGIARLKSDEQLFGEFIPLETEFEGKRYFKLPCPYFETKCTIYDQKKPIVCSKFKCAVLYKVIDGELSKSEAMLMVEETKKLRDQILELYSTATNEQKTFREIIVAVFKEERFENDPQLKVIKHMAHLLDIQLSKHFKSPDEFEMFYETM